MLVMRYQGWPNLKPHSLLKLLVLSPI